MRTWLLLSCLVAVIIVAGVGIGATNSGREQLARPVLVEWIGATRVVTAGITVDMTFKTSPGASCRLYILYELSGECSRIGDQAGWRTANGEGVVSWAWTSEATSQPATALLRVSEDCGESWHSFDFFIAAE